MITDCKVYPGKLQIKFNFPLDPDALEERNSYAATQWNYQWTGNYGSDHYHPQTGEVGEQSLPIESATLSEDGKTLSLNTPDLRPVDQLHLQLDVMDANGKTFNEDIYWTIHGIPQP
jgi:hypothetical protein